METCEASELSSADVEELERLRVRYRVLMGEYERLQAQPAQLYEALHLKNQEIWELREENSKAQGAAVPEVESVSKCNSSRRIRRCRRLAANRRSALNVSELTRLQAESDTAQAKSELSGCEDSLRRARDLQDRVRHALGEA